MTGRSATGQPYRPGPVFRHHIHFYYETMYRPIPLRVRIAQACSVLVLLLSYQLSSLLPPEWAWEDGIIENAQVAVLLVGCLWAGFVALRRRGMPVATLALSAAPVWAILAGRELSWGAVFFAPIGFDQAQPLYSSHELWYKPAVAPVILLMLAWSLSNAWRHRVDRLLRMIGAGCHRATFQIVLAVVAAVLSTGAEGHFALGLQLDAPRAEVWEELLELYAYSALVCAQFLALHSLQALPASAVPAAPAA